METMKPGPAESVQLAEINDLTDFVRPMQPIPERVEAAIAAPIETATVESVTDPMALLTGDGLTDAVVRLPDGNLVIACLTEMPGVSSAMWDWWFAWHSYCSERYRLWHPTDHVAASLAEDRRHLSTNRERWVGNTSYVDEYIGGHLSKLGIAFKEPEFVGLDASAVVELGLAVCAQTLVRDLGIVGGQLIHLVVDADGGSEMRSRFMLGPLPDDFGTALLRHCSEEMNHLARILPELHARFGDQ